VTASDTTSRTNGGKASGRMSETRWSCAKKLVHAEFTSNAGASMPSRRAMLHASAGVALSVTDEPAITMPTSRGSSPGRFLGGADVAVARRADVVERERRVARADADALHDPGLVGADVELFEEGVGDLVLGMEVPEAVQEEAHAPSPETCSPPSTRMMVPFTQAASGVESR
jgi:hypothetical protein